jgi:hypothetical protein
MSDIGKVDPKAQESATSTATDSDELLLEKEVIHGKHHHRSVDGSEGSNDDNPEGGSVSGNDSNAESMVDGLENPSNNAPDTAIHKGKKSHSSVKGNGSDSDTHSGTPDSETVQKLDHRIRSRKGKKKGTSSPKTTELINRGKAMWSDKSDGKSPRNTDAQESKSASAEQSSMVGALKDQLESLDADERKIVFPKWVVQLIRLVPHQHIKELNRYRKLSAPIAADFNSLVDLLQTFGDKVLESAFDLLVRVMEGMHTSSSSTTGQEERKESKGDSSWGAMKIMNKFIKSSDTPKPRNVLDVYSWFVNVLDPLYRDVGKEFPGNLAVDEAVVRTGVLKLKEFMAACNDNDSKRVEVALLPLEKTQTEITYADFKNRFLKAYSQYFKLPFVEFVKQAVPSNGESICLTWNRLLILKGNIEGELQPAPAALMRVFLEGLEKRSEMTEVRRELSRLHESHVRKGSERTWEDNLAMVNQVDREYPGCVCVAKGSSSQSQSDGAPAAGKGDKPAGKGKDKGDRSSQKGKGAGGGGGKKSVPNQGRSTTRMGRIYKDMDDFKESYKDSFPVNNIAKSEFTVVGKAADGCGDLYITDKTNKGWGCWINKDGYPVKCGEQSDGPHKGQHKNACCGSYTDDRSHRWFKCDKVVCPFFKDDHKYAKVRVLLGDVSTDQGDQENKGDVVSSSSTDADDVSLFAVDPDNIIDTVLRGEERRVVGKLLKGWPKVDLQMHLRTEIYPTEDLSKSKVVSVYMDSQCQSDSELFHIAVPLSMAKEWFGEGVIATHCEKPAVTSLVLMDGHKVPVLGMLKEPIQAAMRLFLAMGDRMRMVRLDMPWKHVHVYDDSSSQTSMVVASARFMWEHKIALIPAAFFGVIAVFQRYWAVGLSDTFGQDIQSYAPDLKATLTSRIVIPTPTLISFDWCQSESKDMLLQRRATVLGGKPMFSEGIDFPIGNWDSGMPARDADELYRDWPRFKALADLPPCLGSRVAAQTSRWIPSVGKLGTGTLECANTACEVVVPWFPPTDDSHKGSRGKHHGRDSRSRSKSRDHKRHRRTRSSDSVSSKGDGSAAVAPVPQLMLVTPQQIAAVQAALTAKSVAQVNAMGGNATSAVTTVPVMSDTKTTAQSVSNQNPVVTTGNGGMKESMKVIDTNTKASVAVDARKPEAAVKPDASKGMVKNVDTSKVLSDVQVRYAASLEAWAKRKQQHLLKKQQLCQSMCPPHSHHHGSVTSPSSPNGSSPTDGMAKESTRTDECIGGTSGFHDVHNKLTTSSHTLTNGSRKDESSMQSDGAATLEDAESKSANPEQSLRDFVHSPHVINGAPIPEKFACKCVSLVKLGPAGRFGVNCAARPLTKEQGRNFVCPPGTYHFVPNEEYFAGQHLMSAPQVVTLTRRGGPFRVVVEKAHDHFRVIRPGVIGTLEGPIHEAQVRMMRAVPEEDVSEVADLMLNDEVISRHLDAIGAFNEQRRNEGNLTDPEKLKELHKYLDEVMIPEIKEDLKGQPKALIDYAIIILRRAIDNGVFAIDKDAPPLADAPAFSIKLEPGKYPRSQKVRKWAPEHLKVLKPKLETWLRTGMCVPIKAKAVCNMVAVRKPDGTLRFCCDYRDLNSVTEPVQFPLPTFDDLVSMSGCQWHSTLDGASAFQQVPVDLATQGVLGFYTPWGTYTWTRMPFGVMNGSTHMQCFLQELLGDLGPQYRGFIDDIKVSSMSLLEHLCDLQRLFLRCAERKFSLNLKKCKFFKREVRFMGCIITKDGFRPDPERLAAIRELASPSTRSDLQSALGLLGFNRRFIPAYSNVAKSLYELTKKDVPYVWTPERENAFRTLIRILCESECMLHYPLPDAEFVVFTDGSKEGLAACLAQRVKDPASKDGWVFKAISWDSRGLRGSERNYSPTDLEALAVVWSVGDKYRHYLLGRPFTVVTDHSALKQVFTKQSPSARVMRWTMALSEFVFKVEYRAGRLNHVDYLSRHPVSPAPEEYDYFRQQQERWQRMWGDEGNVPPAASVPGATASPLERQAQLHATQGTLSDWVVPDLVLASDLEQSSDNGSASAQSPKSYARMFMIRGSLNEESKDEESKGDSRQRQSDEQPLIDDDGDDMPSQDDILQVEWDDENPASQEDAVNLNQRESDSPKLPKLQPKDLTFESIKVAQRDDVFCKTVFHLLQGGKERERAELGETKSAKIDVGWGLVKVDLLNYLIQDGALYYRVSRGKLKEGDDSMLQWRLVAPKVAVPAILHVCHDDGVSGHFAATKTLERVRDRFWWPSLMQDVEQYCQSCRVCMAAKGDNRGIQYPMGEFPESDRLFGHCHIDCIITRVPSTKGNTCIIVMTCRRTRAVEAFAVPDHTAATVAKIFFEEICCRYTFPKVLTSDQGSEFCNEVLRQLNEMLGVRHITTTPYHPQGNGKVERLNGVLKQLLRCILADRRSHGDWDDHLPIALLAYRTSVHSATGLSPVHAAHGHPGIAHPVDLRIESPSAKLEGYAALIAERQERVQKWLDKVQREENEAKRVHNATLAQPPHIYKVGDLVYVKKESRADAEHPMVDVKYSGPWLVTEVKLPLSIKVKRQNFPVREQWVHVSKLKPVHLRAEELSLSEPGSLQTDFDFEDGNTLLVLGEDTSQLWIGKYLSVVDGQADKIMVQWYIPTAESRTVGRGRKKRSKKVVSPCGPFELHPTWTQVIDKESVMLVFDSLMPDGNISEDINVMAKEIYRDHQIQWPE